MTCVPTRPDSDGEAVHSLSLLHGVMYPPTNTDAGHLPEIC